MAIYSFTNWGYEGSGVRVVGRLNQNKWTDSDGMIHSEVQIVAEHIEIKKKGV